MRRCDTITESFLGISKPIHWPLVLGTGQNWLSFMENANPHRLLFAEAEQSVPSRDEVFSWTPKSEKMSRWSATDSHKFKSVCQMLISQENVFEISIPSGVLIRLANIYVYLTCKRQSQPTPKWVTPCSGCSCNGLQEKGHNWSWWVVNGLALEAIYHCRSHWASAYLRHISN